MFTQCPIARRAAALAATVLAGIACARAQQAAPAPPSVEALVHEALAGNPSLAALASRARSAREMVAPSGALPDPMVEGMYQEAGFPGYTVGRVEMSMIGVAVRQGFPYPGKREARRDVARAESAVRDAEKETMRRQVARDVRVTYGRIYALDRELAALAASREMLDLLSATAGARYGTGQGDQEAVIKARLMIVRLGERETDLGAMRHHLFAALGRLLGRPTEVELPPITALPPVDFPPDAWDVRAIAASAEVAARRADLEAAEKKVASARLDLKPDFNASAQGSYRGSLDPVVALTFGVELPFWRRQKQLPLLRAAEIDVETARHEVAAAENAVRESASALEMARRQAEAQLARTRDGIVPLAKSALSAARTQYLAGQGPFATVIEDFNMWLDAQVETARRESELFTTWAELQMLIAPAGADR